MNGHFTIHVAPPLDRLPASPLRQWLQSAVEANRVTLVGPEDPHCQLLVELPEGDRESFDRPMRWTVIGPSPPAPIPAASPPPRPTPRPTPSPTSNGFCTAEHPVDAARFQLEVSGNQSPETLGALVQTLVEVARLQCELAGQRQELLEAREAAKAALATAATDYLTGLGSRHDWETRFATELRCPATTPHTWAVMVLDLDGLGAINRAGGMEAGDGWLRLVGQRLRVAADRRQTVARWGGDEFIAAWPAASCESARQEAQRLHAAIADLALPPAPSRPPGPAIPNLLSGNLTDRISSSGGWAWGTLTRTDEPNAEQAHGSDLGHPLRHLIRAAEQALFHAKDLGGRRLCAAP